MPEAVGFWGVASVFTAGEAVVVSSELGTASVVNMNCASSSSALEPLVWVSLCCCAWATPFVYSAAIGLIGEKAI